MSLLELQAVNAWYGQRQVLFDVSLRLAAGDIIALLGANGSGKTTLLRSISQTIKTSGNLSLAGQSLAGQAPEDVVRLGVAHVPQGRGTFEALSVEQNLKLGAYIRCDRASVNHDLAYLYSRLPRLAERRRQQAGTLSGGEQQLLASGRALMLRPRLLLLDEPSFGLAPLMVQEVFELIRTIHREDGVGVLLVEQNAGLALSLAKAAYVLETGRVRLHGLASTLQQEAGVRQAYLGL